MIAIIKADYQVDMRYTILQVGALITDLITCSNFRELYSKTIAGWWLSFIFLDLTGSHDIVVGKSYDQMNFQSKDAEINM